jgi:hypothetical protein
MAHPEKPAFALTDGEMREALKTCPWRSPPAPPGAAPKAPPAAAPAPETDPRKMNDAEFSVALKAGAWRNV